ncbi:hypothetical protein NL108_015437 [Boleophthalmus pectinirostris]|uniref:zinc-binding protein A33-like n=1 Tax=Boleophthalmus pectinirostris TaxID=150288 RepID=UPI0024311412|nr:zinc-binding protein A33-like [Boleophthalmus pectinirostris]KAJ0068953.1 hypothetical protein NL108_015437 [Boleophthalmus pectinirostris]
MAFQPEKDLTCPVCQDIFKDPVVLTCSHSLCKECVSSWWTEKPLQECPVCKRRASRSDPPLNLALRNLCEAYLQQEQKKEHMCPLHSETFKLFCVSDQQPVCVVCRDSETHRDHQVRPIDEATKRCKEDLQTALNPLKDQLELMEEFKENCEISLAHIKTQTNHTARLIEKEFLKLHNFLAEQEESRIKALKDEEERKTQRMKDKIAAVSTEIETLSETIRATEEELRATDISFLLKYKAAVERVQCCPLLEEPQLDPGALINQAKHLGNLVFNIWTNMKKLVEYRPVVLDPNTAHPELVVSDDLSSVQAGAEHVLPKNPERARVELPLVRGSEGFNYGSHSWEVEVESKTWGLGLVTESVFHNTDDHADPAVGWYGIEFQDGQYELFNLHSKKEILVKSKSSPRRIMVHLDCTKRKVTFYDADTNTRIHSISKISQDKLFPIFGSGGPMSILPRKIQYSTSQTFSRCKFYSV